MSAEKWGAWTVFFMLTAFGCSPGASQAEHSNEEVAAASMPGGTSTPHAAPIASEAPDASPQTSSKGARKAPEDGSPSGTPVQKLSIQVLASFPHDPTAFTQGLLWHQGELYESTGLYGRSSLRRGDPKTGQPNLKKNLDRHLFGEGLAWVDDRLIQLTWKAGLAYVYDPSTFEVIDQWGFNGEGWGLTYDGKHLIMSDGSPRLTFRSTEDFRWLKTVEISLEGKPLARVNELEYVDGQIYGNVWGEERIVRIDPETGRVNGIIRATGLLTPQESRMVDVLNGIAYDPESRTFWLTGKFWPRMFQVKFIAED